MLSQVLGPLYAARKGGSKTLARMLGAWEQVCVHLFSCFFVGGLGLGLRV